MDNYRSDKITFGLIFFFLIALFIAYFIILVNSLDTIIFGILDGNLYSVFNPYNKFIEQAVPRVTGLTRSFAIFTLFFLTLFLIKKKNVRINYLIFIIIILFFLIVWMGQSRGSLLCYIIASIFLVIFLNDLHFYKKMIILISIPIITISLNFFITSKSLIITQFAKNYLEIDRNVLSAIDKKIVELNENNKKKKK